jgi:hypothetical protein
MKSLIKGYGRDNRLGYTAIGEQIGSRALHNVSNTLQKLFIHLELSSLPIN